MQHNYTTSSPDTQSQSPILYANDGSVRIQLALDRMTIEEAIDMVRQVEPCIDWIEVGTSLIKEFGMESVRRMRQAFPDKVIVADIKTNDNARYEFELCFQAGANVATVMATAPDATIELCSQTAHEHNALMMIDLLGVPPERAAALEQYNTDAVLCQHVSKDLQEHSGQTLDNIRSTDAGALEKNTNVSSTAIADSQQPMIAAAGGITLQTLPAIVENGAQVVIVGSAITKADHPAQAAQAIRDLLDQRSIL
ncbi:3-hexulose-6-phosphate synthase [Paenibacillus kandeliae]|uniref:3-hexulose-6-phosphate synthase n=1 Tax=Paenibacillus kandeliae TaxID=3231269 RepID=UPI00345A1DBA